MARQVDLNIMFHLMNEEVPFAMEVTDKTRSDVKGGTLIEYNGKLKLLELAQVPEERSEDFKYARDGFNVFNTNNLWISMKELKVCMLLGAIYAFSPYAAPS